MTETQAEHPATETLAGTLSWVITKLQRRGLLTVYKKGNEYQIILPADKWHWQDGCFKLVEEPHDSLR